MTIPVDPTIIAAQGQALITALTGHASSGGLVGALAATALGSVASAAFNHALSNGSIGAGLPIPLGPLGAPAAPAGGVSSAPSAAPAAPVNPAPKTIGLADLAKIGVTPDQAKALGYTVV